MKTLGRLHLLLGLLLTFSSVPALAITTLTVDASGPGKIAGQTISAQAVFEFTTHEFVTDGGTFDALKITLTNTTDTSAAGYQHVRGDLLTGIFFSIDGLASADRLLSTAPAYLNGIAPYGATFSGTGQNIIPTYFTNRDISPATSGTPSGGQSVVGTYSLSNLWNEGDKLDNNWTDFDGNGERDLLGAEDTPRNWGFNDDNNDGIDDDGYYAEYVLATVAYGLGGLQGSVTGGDNYGITPDNSLLLGNYKTAGALIEQTATFYIRRPATLTDLNQISVAAFGLGSLPDGVIIAPPNVIPEPSSALLVGLGLGGLAWFARRRRPH